MHSDGHLTVEVVDDGVGGADPSRGSGLVGLMDRVGALAGRLDVASEAGRGSRVTATLPCMPRQLPDDHIGRRLDPPTGSLGQ